MTGHKQRQVAADKPIEDDQPNLSHNNKNNVTAPVDATSRWG